MSLFLADVFSQMVSHFQFSYDSTVKYTSWTMKRTWAAPEPIKIKLNVCNVCVNSRHDHANASVFPSDSLFSLGQLFGPLYHRNSMENDFKTHFLRSPCAHFQAFVFRHFENFSWKCVKLWVYGSYFMVTYQTNVGIISHLWSNVFRDVETEQRCN